MNSSWKSTTFWRLIFLILFFSLDFWEWPFLSFLSFDSNSGASTFSFFNEKRLSEGTMTVLIEAGFLVSDPVSLSTWPVRGTSAFWSLSGATNGLEIIGSFVSFALLVYEVKAPADYLINCCCLWLSCGVELTTLSAETGSVLDTFRVSR